MLIIANYALDIIFNNMSHDQDVFDIMFFAHEIYLKEAYRQGTTFFQNGSSHSPKIAKQAPRGRGGIKMLVHLALLSYLFF